MSRLLALETKLGRAQTAVHIPQSIGGLLLNEGGAARLLAKPEPCCLRLHKLIHAVFSELRKFLLTQHLKLGRGNEHLAPLLWARRLHTLLPLIQPCLQVHCKAIIAQEVPTCLNLRVLVTLLIAAGTELRSFV